jgi:N-acetylmuramoyl-L-alanine amidase
MRIVDRARPEFRPVADRPRRWGWRLAALICLAIASFWLKPVGAGVQATAVRDVRIASHGDQTRVVIDLDRAVSFHHLTLEEPDRLAIDLPAIQWRVPADRTAPVGIVRGFRVGHFQSNVLRVVFDIDGPFEIRRVFELPPNEVHGHRIVTDLVASGINSRGHATNGTTNGLADHVAADGAARTQTAALSVAKPPAPKPRRTNGKHIVVIDPGHGGIDPGAIGSRGTYEKDVVLAVGLELRRRLKATGRYDVVMTRDRDEIMRLRDRLRIARESGGDFFISLHADSLVQSPDVRGASVYTLSEKASNEEAAELARKENRADILAGVDLTNQESIVTEILIDLAQRDSNNKSVEVAEYLVEELRAVTNMARRHRSQAGFVVLKSPDMPSTLVELGYLSSAKDEKALSDPAHVAKLAAAMHRAIDRYFAKAS